MAGIDPIYVLVFITVIVGVVSLVVFLSPTVPSPQPTVTAVKPSKKKKPSSGSKSKPSASKKKHVVPAEVDNATELSPSELSETEQPKAVVKFEDPLPVAPVTVSSEEPATVFADTATEITEPKKGKKAKETPEQKEARLQRAKLAKEKSKETTDASSSLLSSAPSSSLAADFNYNAQISVPTTTSTPQHFDGWAIVDEKRKGKSKKSESDTSPDAEASTPVPAPAPAASVPEPETAGTSLFCGCYLN